MFLPPAITNRLQRSTAPARQDVAQPASPDVSPASSRSSSFTGGRPPQHHPAPRAVHSETKLQRQQRAMGVRKQASCGAGDALCRPRDAPLTPPAQQPTTYGRFSLDESPAWPYPAGPPQSAAWPAGAFMCGSPTPSAAGYSSHASMMTPGQQTSWASTVSGDTCMLAAGGGDPAAVLASAQQLECAQQHERDLQLLQAQRQQLLQMAQQEQERQELLSQLGGVCALGSSNLAACLQPCANSMAAHDSALLAQLQYTAPGRPGTSQRRASLGCYDMQATGAQLHVRDTDLDGQAYSLPLHPNNQLPAQATCPLPSVGTAAGAVADAYDSALEAQLDAALQQLLVMRSEVAHKKALAKQAKAAQRAGLGSAPDTCLAAARALAASPAASGGLPAAAVLSSQLFQPYSTTAAGTVACPANISVNTGQAPCVHACMPLANQDTAFSGFAPMAPMPGCVPGSCFGAAGQGVHTSGAGSMPGFSTDGCLHASLGHAAEAGGSLADFLGCHAGAQQPTDQEQLQLLALCQAGSAAVSLSQAPTC